jgi:hypothetical protein
MWVETQPIHSRPHPPQPSAPDPISHPPDSVETFFPGLSLGMGLPSQHTPISHPPDLSFCRPKPPKDVSPAGLGYSAPPHSRTPRGSTSVHRLCRFDRPGGTEGGFRPPESGEMLILLVSRLPHQGGQREGHSPSGSISSPVNSRMG